MNGEVEIRKLGAVGRRLERALQFVEQGLVARCASRRRIILVSVRRRVVPAIGGDIGGAHEDRAVIRRQRAEPGHAAVEQIGGVAVEVAQRRLDAEQARGIRRAGRKSQLLRPAFEAVIGRYLVGTRQRLGVRLTVDSVEGQLRHALLGDLDLAAADADRVRAIRPSARREAPRRGGPRHSNCRFRRP